MSLSKEQEKLVEMIQKLLKLPPETRERIIRIVTENPPQKLKVALENAYKYTKHGKTKPVMTLEEFERMLKRVRW